MRINTFISIVTVGLLAVFNSGCATSQARLEAQAKISKADAEKIALAKVPGGAVKNSELEKEDGKLIWSFDIATPDSKDITEVAVDAKNGEIVAVDKETPEQQAKEEAEDTRKEKKAATASKGESHED
jgi:lipopolysaccharide export LptBFGC system permease protein LptF